MSEKRRTNIQDTARKMYRK